LADVSTRHKSFVTRTAEHNHPDVGVVHKVLHDLGQGGPHVIAHGVEFFGVVEHDMADMALFEMLKCSHKLGFRGGHVR
jgi:hypothetical protein